MTTVRIYGTSPHGKEILRHEGEPWQTKDPVPVAVVIPTIPPRIHMVNRALKSIERQDRQPELVIVQVDDQAEGAPMTRNKGLQHVPESCEWVAFLDDDDYFGPSHLSTCLLAAHVHAADYVYPWFTIAGPSIDPFPQFYKRSWDDDDPHQTTIVTLVRRELAQAVGFREVDEEKTTKEGHTFGEDFQFTLECLAKGARIVHVPEKTWYWVVTGHNTSGRPEAWEKVR